MDCNWRLERNSPTETQYGNTLIDLTVLSSRWGNEIVQEKPTAYLTPLTVCQQNQLVSKRSSESSAIVYPASNFSAGFCLIHCHSLHFDTAFKERTNLCTWTLTSEYDQSCWVLRQHLCVWSWFNSFSVGPQDRPQMFFQRFIAWLRLKHKK